MHHKIDNTRKDFHFKQAHALCDVADMIFMEDLDYRVSAKGLEGKHMLDAAFGQFRSITQYVCWKRDKFFAQVDARGTSQECPECGAIEEVGSRQVEARKYRRNLFMGHIDKVSVNSSLPTSDFRLPTSFWLGGMETVCAVGLPGAKETSSRSEAKPRKGKTRKISS